MSRGAVSVEGRPGSPTSNGSYGPWPPPGTILPCAPLLCLDIDGALIPFAASPGELPGGYPVHRPGELPGGYPVHRPKTPATRCSAGSTGPRWAAAGPTGRPGVGHDLARRGERAGGASSRTAVAARSSTGKTPTDAPTGRHWKTSALRDRADGRALAWFDDELTGPGCWLDRRSPPRAGPPPPRGSSLGHHRRGPHRAGGLAGDGGRLNAPPQLCERRRPGPTTSVPPRRRDVLRLWT